MTDYRFPKVLKELRKKNHMTQQELADRLNVTQKLVTFWENEYRRPTIDRFMDISVVFGVSIDYLVYGDA